MSEWICKDVGLVINELRDRYSTLLSELEDKEEESQSKDVENQIKGLHMAYDILDEVANDWLTDTPPWRVLDQVKGE